MQVSSKPFFLSNKINPIELLIGLGEVQNTFDDANDVNDRVTETATTKCDEKHNETGPVHPQNKLMNAETPNTNAAKSGSQFFAVGVFECAIEVFLIPSGSGFRLGNTAFRANRGLLPDRLAALVAKLGRQGRSVVGCRIVRGREGHADLRGTARTFDCFPGMIVVSGQPGGAAGAHK